MGCTKSVGSSLANCLFLARHSVSLSLLISHIPHRYSNTLLVLFNNRAIMAQSSFYSGDSASGTAPVARLFPRRVPDTIELSDTIPSEFRSTLQTRNNYGTHQSHVFVSLSSHSLKVLNGYANITEYSVQVLKCTT